MVLFERCFLVPISNDIVFTHETLNWSLWCKHTVGSSDSNPPTPATPHCYQKWERCVSGNVRMRGQRECQYANSAVRASESGALESAIHTLYLQIEFKCSGLNHREWSNWLFFPYHLAFYFKIPVPALRRFEKVFSVTSKRQSLSFPCKQWKNKKESRL